MTVRDTNASNTNDAAAIAGRNLTYAYDSDGEPVAVVKDFSITIKPGEVVCLFGPNGCGKSTLLRLCAGLLSPSSGSITILGQPPTENEIGLIPQSFGESLFPWLTNLDNIAFPLYMNGIPKKDARAKAKETALRFSDSLPLERHPGELSIGQQQLVCLARALVVAPAVLFADEPFSALDFQTRRDIQDIFHRVLDPQLGIGALLISHQVEDAVHMADKVIVTSPVPMTPVGIIEIPEQRPRSQGFKASRAFFDLSNAVTEAFAAGGA
jgi:NitT/TauT family transport system ATP-binding protein